MSTPLFHLFAVSIALATKANSQFIRRKRHELTSYSVRGAGHAQAKR